MNVNDRAGRDDVIQVNCSLVEVNASVFIAVF